eukprot:scaffold362759_cov36-Prasinocladus_malaysianus.AAC.1
MPVIDRIGVASSAIDGINIVTKSSRDALTDASRRVKWPAACVEASEVQSLKKLSRYQRARDVKGCDSQTEARLFRRRM